jgi:hypothetical protein
MAHFLDASQLAEACQSLGLHDHATALEAAAQSAADAIAEKLGIEIVSDADTVPGMGGLCVGFGPSRPDQKLPDEIAEYDDCSDWCLGEDA